MNNLLSIAKKYVNKLLGYLPKPLPQGLTAFNAWAQSIIDIYDDVAPGVPLEEKKAVLATMIMGLPSTKSYASWKFFATAMHKGASNQVASQVFYDFKQGQRAAELAAKQATPQPKAVTSTEEAAPNVPQGT